MSRQKGMPPSSNSGGSGSRGPSSRSSTPSRRPSGEAASRSISESPIGLSPTRSTSSCAGVSRVGADWPRRGAGESAIRPGCFHHGDLPIHIGKLKSCRHGEARLLGDRRFP